jgi:hypothetical protein
MRNMGNSSMKSSTNNPVRLIVPVTDSTLMEVLISGGGFQEAARRVGGDGRVFRLPGSVQIDLEGLSHSRIDLFVSALAGMVKKDKGDLEIARSVRTTELPPNVISGEFLHEKLTKKFLLGLPKGAWLVGNCSPHWIAHISDRTDHQRVWKQAREARANHRLVSVVWSEQDAKLVAGGRDFFFSPTISLTECLKRSIRLQIPGEWGTVRP